MTDTYTRVYDDADNPDDAIYPGIEGLLFGLIPATPRWMARAACRGMPADMFFPSRGDSCEPARLICAGCEVVTECGEYAIREGEKLGVWGGLSARDRTRPRRRGRLHVGGLAS